MPLTVEDRKNDLVDKLAAEARARVSEDGRESAEHFVRRYFALVAPDDIIYSSFEALLGGALSLWEFGEIRGPGKAKIRLFNPTAESNGWALDRTVIEIVNDDMPFLMDSISAELDRLERHIHFVLHPLVRVRRDTAGQRLEFASNGATAAEAITECYVHIEIDEESEPAELDKICRWIEEVLDQVRVAVADFEKMRAQLAKEIAELENAKVPMPEEEVSEARQFLRWLDDDNFIFLGYRRYSFETRGDDNYLPPQPQTGLGILREISPKAVEFSNAPLAGC